MSVKLMRVSEAARVPVRSTEGSAYYDLFTAEGADLGAGCIKRVSTGWRIEVPPGYFLDIRPRGGWSAEGITINNSPGTADEDFRGELMIVLVNHSRKSRYIGVGERVAQCALMPVIPTSFEVVESLSETKRGTGSFASTGW